MWSDWLSRKEGEYTAHVLEELQAVGWASELLRRIKERGGIIAANQPLLFEARFAYELFRRGKEAQYEYPAGVGNSTIEFRITNSKEWLIELVSVRESEGVRFATKKSGNHSSMVLISHNQKKSALEEQKQTPEAEMITAQRKIGEKVFVKGDAQITFRSGESTVYQEMSISRNTGRLTSVFHDGTGGTSFMVGTCHAATEHKF